MIVKAIIEEPEQDQGTHLYLGRSRSAYTPPTDYSRSPPDGRTFFPRQLAQLTNDLGLCLQLYCLQCFFQLLMPMNDER